ncbi:MAG: DUF3267 domain-containing protein [Clostridia bacterium]|nr:DUF3267 domain-containing protein [Clostridia bacterium]
MAEQPNIPNRKLTRAELERYAAFLKREEKLLEAGYKRKDIIVSIITANLLGTLVAAIPCIPAAIAFFAIHGTEFVDKQKHPLYMVGYLLLFVALIFVHEMIHGLFWSIGAENHLKDIRFGFVVQYLTPYCTCSSPLKKPIYIIGTFMPMFILGICVMIVSIILGNVGLFVVGVLHTLAGAGDILIILKLLAYKSKGKDVVFIDHPYECGLVAFEKDA